jgi:hypothetical protein
MKDKCLIALFLGMALTVSAPAQVSVYVGITPPPIPYEPPPPPPPVVGMVWVGGFWAPQGHHYRWVSGHYDRPPYPGAAWSHPHYDHYREGWRYDEGHWGHEDHDHGHEDHDHGHGHGHD